MIKDLVIFILENDLSTTHRYDVLCMYNLFNLTLNNSCFGVERFLKIKTDYKNYTFETRLEKIAIPT